MKSRSDTINQTLYKKKKKVFSILITFSLFFLFESIRRYNRLMKLKVMYNINIVIYKLKILFSIKESVTVLLIKRDRSSTELLKR